MERATDSAVIFVATSKRL